MLKNGTGVNICPRPRSFQRRIIDVAQHRIVWLNMSRLRRATSDLEKAQQLIS